jgi:hypothetical protein
MEIFEKGLVLRSPYGTGQTGPTIGILGVRTKTTAANP